MTHETSARGERHVDRARTDAAMTGHSAPTRRIELTLHKPRYALYAGIRPTLVIEGRGQPVQWGHGTWQVPADRDVAVGVFLFTRLWRFGQAECTIAPGDPPAVRYAAPALPFTRGRFAPVESSPRRRDARSEESSS